MASTASTPSWSAPAIRLGLFESVASVGPGATILVYPQVLPLPGWRPARRPPSRLSSARGRQGPHLTPVVTSVRPYTPGDAFNRIHWRSSARHQELQVKEFDIEPSADLWIFLDLQRDVHRRDRLRQPPWRVP